MNITSLDFWLATPRRTFLARQGRNFDWNCYSIHVIALIIAKVIKFVVFVIAINVVDVIWDVIILIILGWQAVSSNDADRLTVVVNGQANVPKSSSVRLKGGLEVVVVVIVVVVQSSSSWGSNSWWRWWAVTHL